MIPRYVRPEMAAIWTPEARFAIWLEVETLAAEAMAGLGQIPAEAARAIRARGGFDVARIDAIEREVKHDVIAFLTSVGEHVGPEARFLHLGMTSSDVLDTALAVQLVRAAQILIAGVDRVLAALRTRAFEHRLTLCIARSHGVHAEPTTFGVKLAGHHAEFARGRARLEAALAAVATCKLSGPVGTYASIDPRVEEEVAARLAALHRAPFRPETVATQVIPRDRHAEYFTALALVASAVERLATEIRHLQRTEVLEVEEYFSEGQKGSSAMPHKRNPVLTENVTGLARLVRSAVIPALENVTLWHERDISHSSVERGIAPDATAHLDFALHRIAGVVEQLIVYPDRMRANLDRLGGLHNSQRVLLALIDAGASREAAYRLVQRNAMKTWGGDGAFVANLKADAEVGARLPPAKVDALFDDAFHTRHVDAIFARAFGDGGGPAD